MGNSVYNFGSVALNARCNWWGVASGANTTGTDRIAGSVSGNYNASSPVTYSIAYEEMLFPVFGEGRTVSSGTLTDDQLVPAIVANSYVPGTHNAVDIVPINAFDTGTTCQQRRNLSNPNWDQSYADYQSNVASSESLKTVYAVVDGTLTAFVPSPQPCSVPCNAQLTPNPNITTQYDNYQFSYSHIVLVPPLANNQTRQLYAGKPIGYIRNHQSDQTAGSPSHLHFAVLINGVVTDPRKYLTMGLMDDNDQKGYRTLCPDQSCV